MAAIALKDIRQPEVHLPGPDAVSRFDWPKVDLSSVDVGKSVADAASAVHIGRASRPRWPLAVGGLIVAGLAGWAIMSNAALRARLARGVAAIREQVSAMRSGRYADGQKIDAENPIAFAAAETKPIEDSPFTDETTSEPDYPPGLGSNNGDGLPAFEETRSGT
jgi:hypothetical protein